MHIILIALAVLLCWSEAAQAELISTAIGLTSLISSVFGASAAIAGAVGGVIVGGALSIGLNYATRLLTGSGQIQQNAPGVNSSEARMSTRQSAPSKRVPYGIVHAGGALCFEECKPPYFTRMLLISAEEIDGLEAIYLGTQKLSFAALTPNEILTPLAVDGQPNYPSRLRVSFRRGETDQDVCPLLYSSYPNLFSASIDRTAGTVLGNMTGGAGLAGAFSGVTSQHFAISASTNGTGALVGTIGKDWGVGVTRKVVQFSFYAPNDIAASTFALSVTLEGSSDNFVSDINVLCTVETATFAAGSSRIVTGGINTATAYRYHRLKFTEQIGSGTPHSLAIAQVQFSGLNDTDFNQFGIATFTFECHYGSDDEEHRSLWGITGEPEFLLVMRGVKVYDPRDPTQDSYDAETWKFSRTAVLAQNDYLRRDFGGRIPASKIPYDEVRLDADYDDGLISCLDGTFIPRYQLDGMVTFNQSPGDTLGQMLTANRGATVQTSGYVWCASSRPRTSVATIYDDILAGGIHYQNDKAKRDVVNYVQTRFIAPEREYNLADGPPYTVEDDQTADGEKLVATLQLPFTRDYRAAQRLAKAFYDTNRLGKILTTPVDLRILAEATDQLPNNPVTFECSLFPKQSGIYKIGQMVLGDSYSSINLEMSEYNSAIETDWIASRDEQPFTVADLDVS